MSACRQSFPVVYRHYTVLMTMLLSGWMVAAYDKKKIIIIIINTK